MADYKVVYVFTSPSGGWTETFFDTIATPPTAVALDPVEYTSILAWRGGGVTLRAKKWIEEGGLRRSRVINLNLLSPRTGIDAASRMEVAGVAVKVRLNFNGGGGRILQVRGVADGDIIGNESGEPQVQGVTLNGITAYLAYIGAGANAYQGRRLLSAAVNPWKNVVNISLDPANSSWTLVTIEQVAPVPTAGSLVYFRGVDKSAIPWLGGVFRVVGTPTATTFSIPTRYRLAVAQTSLRNVQWREASYEYPDINGGNIVYVGTRDTAAPFGRRRGARSRLRARL
jgi:hypothetical protein